MNIITYPNPILKKKSIKVDVKEIKNKKFQKLCLDMIQTMKEKNGKGLAAPQIGKNIRVIIVDTKEGQIAMINPVITKTSWTKEWGDEGCLSVLTSSREVIFGKVKRYKKINYKYIDKNGQEIKIKANGLLARIIQHEIDHLDGVLFIDNLSFIKNSKI
ncbi:MAG: peptide deformylase [Patescibacteria group bacterium]|nr:peptide deformylase [Patescibacteria group bacterium]MBU1684017.1 peptide deformylase [Patescibacteria group bacterium]MBU1987305.1 peptide deformylase [Patescibacteria group bacterium]MBU2474745.1 peptide deformylase [Patescibacteria group bacterium]